MEMTENGLSTFSTFPLLSQMDLSKVQSQDPELAVVRQWLSSGHKPTVRQLYREPVEVRKILRISCTRRRMYCGINHSALYKKN